MCNKQGSFSEVSSFLDPGERVLTKRGPLYTAQGADFSLLESQTSYKGFEFPTYSLFAQDNQND